MKQTQSLLGWRSPEWVSSALLGGFTVGVFTLQGLASGDWATPSRYERDGTWSRVLLRS